MSAAGRGDARGARLGGTFAVSVLLHGAVFASLLVLHASAPRAMPPMYRVNIVAAPPGPRAAGIVPITPTPAPPAAEKPPPVPKRAEQIEKMMPAPSKAKPPARKPTAPATPTPNTAPAKSKTPPPQAGGGPTGGRGTDVASVHTEGVDFPYPAYLENIVRQIAVRFHPEGTSGQAEVMFLIRRDGTVSDFRFLTRSGNFAFDLECQGAVDQAAQVKAFGPLPTGFTDDVLPVIFSFDPKVLH